jgi:hypothetical protein
MENMVMFGAIGVTFAVLGIAWNVAIMVLLVLIWRKVRHLPG